MYSEREKKAIKYFILFCALLGVVLGLIAGYKAGKSDQSNTIQIENKE